MNTTQRLDVVFADVARNQLFWACLSNLSYWRSPEVRIHQVRALVRVRKLVDAGGALRTLICLLSLALPARCITRGIYFVEQAHGLCPVEPHAAAARTGFPRAGGPHREQ